MGECFRMASDLEVAAIELEKAKTLLAITLEDVFNSAERKYLSGYVQGFEYLIEAALDKIIAQYKVVNDISNTLYQASKIEKKLKEENK